MCKHTYPPSNTCMCIRYMVKPLLTLPTERRWTENQDRRPIFFSPASVPFMFVLYESV